MTGRPGGGPGGLVRRGVNALRVVLVPFVLARVIVLGALGVAHLVLDRTHPENAGMALRVHQGLLAWDGGFYEAIARYGYRPFGHQALRFFPLFPLAGRALADATGIGVGASLVVIANLAALVGTALVVVLVRRETGDAALATRSAWLLSLAPPAFTFVFGYAEGLLLLFVSATFLALRPAAAGRPAWLWVALFSYAAGLTRPLGVVLVLPIAVVLVGRWRPGGRSERLVAVAAICAPVLGLVTFLAWSADAFSDFWLPLRVQTSAGHHGGLSDPVRTLIDDAKGALHHHIGTALHVPWVLLVLVLLVVCWRRLPVAYSLFATGIVAVALSGTNLDSFERYALSAFPLVVAAATLLRRRSLERVVLVLSAIGLAAYTLLALLNVSVP